jgi:hypothetical protein
MAEWSGGVRPRRRSIPAELENKAMRRMTPDLPEAPGAVSSPQVPGMTPDRTTVPGHEAEVPRRVGEEGKRKPLTESGTAQSMAAVYRPSGEHGVWQPRDFEQAPAAFEELRKVDFRLTPPQRPVPGYETVRALAQREQRAALAAGEAAERAALAAGLSEEGAAVAAGETEERAALVAGLPTADAAASAGAGATMLAAAGAAATPAAPGEITSGTDGPQPPVVAEAQRTASETGLAAPAEAVAAAEAALAPPVVPTDAEATVGQGGVGQAPSERDSKAQAAPSPGQFTGVAQEVATGSSAGAQDRPGEPSSLVAPEVSGESAQESGFGPREDRANRPTAEPAGLGGAAPSAASAAGGTDQPQTSADAATRSGAPAADVLETEAARANLTGNLDPSAGAEAGAGAVAEAAAAGPESSSASGTASWGSPDTGLPIAEPVPRDVAPEGGPIPANDGADGAGGARDRRGGSTGTEPAAGDRTATGADPAASDRTAAAAELAAGAEPAAGAGRAADSQPAVGAGPAAGAGSEAGDGHGRIAEPRAGAARSAAAGAAGSPSGFGGAAAAPRRAGFVHETAEGGAGVVRRRASAPTNAGFSASAAAVEPGRGAPAAPEPTPLADETAALMGGPAAGVEASSTGPAPDAAAFGEAGGGPAAAPVPMPVSDVAMPDEADLVGDRYAGDQQAAAGPAVGAGRPSPDDELALSGLAAPGDDIARERFGAAQPSVTAAPSATAGGDQPRSMGAAADDASLGAAQPVGFDAGFDAPIAAPGTGRVMDAEADPTAAAATGSAGPAGAVAGNGSPFCPPGYPVKGNASSQLYHQPHQSSYERTIPEFCFRAPADAEAAGYRAARGGH